MRRREFLIVSSMSAAAVAARADAAKRVPAPSSADPAMELAPNAAQSSDAHVIVYDSRHPAAIEFAQRQVEQGARALSTDDCMVSLWRGPLSECVARGETRIRGFTTYSDFTIAREYARDRGLSVLEEQWCRDCPATFVSWLIGK